MPRFSSALDVVQVSDPATPVAGRQYLYFKSDGKVYTKKPDGTVVAVADASYAPTFPGLNVLISTGPVISLGRTAVDAAIVVAGTAGSYSADSAIGDLVIRAQNGKMRIGSEATGVASTLVLTSAAGTASTAAINGSLSISGTTSHTGAASFAGPVNLPTAAATPTTQFVAWTALGGAWLNMGGAELSGIGDSGVGNNCWIAKTSAIQQFLFDAAAGDIVYRGALGQTLRFGINNSTGNSPSTLRVAQGAVTVAGTLTSTGILTEGASRVYSASNLVPVAGMSATGTPSAATYLRGDGTWTAPPTVDSTAVHLAGAESISGIKTFTAVPVLPASTVTITNLIATGTPSATTFLRGDGTWSVPAGGTPAVVSITTTTTASTNTIYLANGTFNVTVPVTAGLQATIKNTGTGTITVLPASGTIDGGPSAVLSPLVSINVVSDGVNVWVL